MADRRVSVVADDGEQLVGMVGGDWDEQSGRVHLVALWVEPSSRGRGVGKALVAEVLSGARERQAHRVELWVVDDALAAAALYALVLLWRPASTRLSRTLAGRYGEAACPSGVAAAAASRYAERHATVRRRPPLLPGGSGSYRRVVWARL